MEDNKPFKVLDRIKPHLTGFIVIVLSALVLWLASSLVIYAFHINFEVTIMQIISVMFGLLVLYFLLYIGSTFVISKDSVVEKMDTQLKSAYLLISSLIAHNGNDGEAYLDFSVVEEILTEEVYFEMIKHTPNDKVGFILKKKNGERYLGG